MFARHKFYAAAAHIITALGAIPALLALSAVSERQYETAFAWLGLAFIIDGIDGPIARRFQTKLLLPRFCGERLDLIIDYLTYVVIPAFVVHTAKLVPEGLATASAAFIMLSSLYHFADQHSKTEDGYFVGFPAIWNIVVFYLLAVPVAPFAALAIIIGLGLFTFVPVKWLHPVRVTTLRRLTFAVMALWAASAVIVVYRGFPADPVTAAILLITGLYALSIGLFRSAGSLGQETKSSGRLS